LFQRGKAGLIAHHILAVPHGGQAQRGALGGDGGGDDEGDAVVLQQRLGAGGQRRGRVLAGKLRAELGLGGVKASQLGAGAQQQSHLVIDVAVVEADGGEFDGHRRNSGRSAYNTPRSDKAFSSCS
jgi:hypothetical protein